ncbi:MAG: hypothetical protein HY315_04920 [Acidobacteria bacterium]|nr:hypothetical protein [Acidobacteriota bacterium]
MGQPVIRSEQERAAWTMLRTLAEEYALSPMEQSFLLHAVGRVALRNSLEKGEIEWTASSRRIRLSISDSRVIAGMEATTPLALSPDTTEEDADSAYHLAERLLDLHEMPEQERVGLYSALPCLAFYALQGCCLTWRVTPPFGGITAGECASHPPKRRRGKKRRRR